MREGRGSTEEQIARSPDPRVPHGRSCPECPRWGGEAGVALGGLRLACVTRSPSGPQRSPFLSAPARSWEGDPRGDWTVGATCLEVLVQRFVLQVAKLRPGVEGMPVPRGQGGSFITRQATFPRERGATGHGLGKKFARGVLACL